MECTLDINFMVFAISSNLEIVKPRQSFLGQRWTDTNTTKVVSSLIWDIFKSLRIHRIQPNHDSRILRLKLIPY